MAVQINVAANQAALTASIQAGVQAYNQRFAQNNPINLSINQRAFSQPLGRMTGDVKDFEAALAASNARVIAFGASTAVLGGVIRSFKELANVTIDVEKNLADINRVFGLTTSQLQKFSTDLFSVGKQTASSFDDASKAALEFSRQGLKAEEVLIRTKDALTLARVAGISTANSVDALTSTINGFSATGITTTQILNKLVAVEQDFAVGAGDLAEALSRTGQAAQEAGVSFDQLNALVTSAQQSTARGGAVIGNALKTIFTRLQRTETLDQLEAFNIAVRDVQGNTLPAVSILQNFAGAYKDLADAQRAQLSEQVAGVYQVNILKAIVGDLNKSQGVYAGALQRGASATNEAEVATAKLNQTLDALLKQTATSTQQLANNIGKVTFEPLARYGTEQLKSLVESMNEILEGEGVGSTFANGLLKGIRNVIAGPGAIAAFFTLFKLIQNSFTYLAQALPQIAGITTETQNRKNIEQSILQIMQQQGPVSQALAGSMGNQAAQAQLLLQLARQQTAEYQIQSTLAKQLATQLAGQGVRVKGSGGLQVTRAGGYIPAATRMAETVGAQAGGYAPGKVVKSPVGGVMNTAEDVKYVPGFAQPFINPPAGSKAGRTHRQNAINRTGVDPYMNSGFIPNFGNPKNVIDKSYTGHLNLLKIDSLKEKKQIQEVADLETEITNKLGKKEVINDKITGFGIKYDIEEIKGKSNATYRKEAADLALSGNIAKIKESMPANKTTAFNATQWAKNLKDLKNKGIDLSSSNIENLSRLENEVPSLVTGETVEFGRQFTGLLSALSGEAFEKDIGKQKEKLFARSRKSNARLDFESSDKLYLGGEAKLGGITLGNLVAKAIESTGRKYENGEEDKIAFSKSIKLFVPEEHKLLNKGFIPNFAPPISMLRIPWFKKYANPSFDAKQPTLNIAGANAVDTFRSTQFRTNKTDYNKKAGDGNVFGPIYEKFVRSSISLQANKSKIKSLILGQSLEPDTIQGESSFDSFMELVNTNPTDLLDLVGIEIKGGPKDSQSGGSATGIITKKYNNFATKNPKAAARLRELLGVFNEPGNPQHLQYMSALGKEFLPLAATNYDEIAKNSPELLKVLSQKTNELLTSYVNNPSFYRAEASGGFIPNFNMGDKMRKNMMKNNLRPIVHDLKTGKEAYAQPGIKGKEYLYHKDAYNAELKTAGANINDYDFAELHNLVRGFIYPNGTITWDYSEKQQEALQDPNVKAKILAKLNAVQTRIPKPIQSSKPLTELQRTRAMLENQYTGFVPNFADLIDVDTLSQNSVHYSGDLMKLIKDIESSVGRHLTSGELRLLTNPKTNLSKLNDPNVLNRFINSERKGGFAGFAKGFTPNFASRREMIRDLVKFNLESTPDIKDKNVFGSKTTLFRGVRNERSSIFGQSRNYSQTADSADYFRDTDINKIANDHIKEKKLLPFLSASTDEDIAKYFARGRRDYNLTGEGKVGSKTIKNSRIFSAESISKFTKKYGQKALKELMMEHSTWGTFGSGKGIAMNFESYSGKEGFEGTDFAKEISFLSNGFIPNFAYKQAVMGLEESMSGEKAVFDTKPFPHIRNKSQPTFSSAISDHGGLSNALSDSMRGQKNAGLMNRGFVPNFATVKSQDAFGVSSKALPDVDRRAFVEMNQALKKLTQDLTLTTKEQNALKLQIMQNARVLQVNTGSANIVTLANTALRKSITDNATAQALLAQKTRDQAAAAAVAATAATASAAASAAASKATAEAAAAAKTQAKKTRRQDLKNLSSEQREQRIKQELANDPKTAARYQKRFGPNGGSLEEQIGGVVGGFAGRRRGTRINQSVKALSGVGFQLAAPMIGGMLEQIVSRGRGREDMSVSERFASSAPSSILTGLSTGAFVGTALGGPGIGTAVGAIVGLGQAALSAQDSISDLANAAESYRAASTQTVEGAKSYIDQLSQIGSVKDESLLNQATYKLSETFQKLSESSPELARKFNEASGDVGKMQQAIQEFTKEASLISGIKSLSSSYKKQERPFVEYTATRVNELKKKGYDVNESTAKIEKVTEANLQTSFVQFQGFFDMLKQSGLDENQTKSFATDYQKELQAGVTSETALTNIGLKNGMSKKVAEEFAVLGDNRIQEMGTEGTFFIDNMQEITQRYFDKTKQNFKTTIDKSKAIQFNSRELLLNLRKGIDDYIFNASMQIQEKEFDSARLDVLDSAVGEFIDKITSPLEVAGRQAEVKLRQTAMSQQNERTRLSSDVINTSGKQIFERLGGGNQDIIEKTLKPILANLQNPETQQQALEDLITKTSSTKNAKDAGFVGDPEKIAEFNAQLIQQLKSTVSLSAKQKQQLTLVELEIKMSQRRAENAQALIELEGKLINRELERNKVLNKNFADEQIRAAKQKALFERPGFGFGMSPTDIQNKKGSAEREATLNDQGLAREKIFFGGGDFLKNITTKLSQDLELASAISTEKLQTASPSDFITGKLDQDAKTYQTLTKAQSDLKSFSFENIESLDEYKNKLNNLFNSLTPISGSYKESYDAIAKQLTAINDLENSQRSQLEILDISLETQRLQNLQIGLANKLYNDRLRIVLETASAEQNFRNSLEIDSQRIDAFKSRDANFYGLGVTGKANLEIQKNNENLGINQQQTRLNSLTKARGSLNEFAMYRGGIENLTGPLTKDQNAAKNAISNINPTINNLEDAKRVADELRTARQLVNPTSDEAKKLADFEYQIRQTLQDNTSELDKQQKLQEILNGKVRQEAQDRQSIRMGFKEGFDQIQDDADTGLNRLAKDTPILFRDGMVDAIKATIRETDNLDAALMGVASKFLDTFSTQLMNTGISKIISGSGLGSIFGAQTGGYIRAQSGMYISGTGTGDKYPAMLENGEYVLNRRAVMAMGGPAALDTLNFSAAPRFASGGTFKKEFNDISSMEANMTQMGLENSPYYNELNDAAKQKAAEDRAKKLEAKKQKAAMIGSLVAAAATIAIGAGISNVASNMKATNAQKLSAKVQATGGTGMTNSEMGKLASYQKSGLLGKNFEYTGGAPQTGFRSLTSKPFYSSNIYDANPYAPAFKKNGRQTGGLIGSRLSDTIPGYMEGGLYDSPMVKRYGTGMQSGGSSISSAGNSNSTVNNNTSANNSFNFNTSVQRDGSLKMGSNTTSYEQQDIELSKNLNNKIYAAVGEVIRKEKQFGGSLAGVRT